VSSRSIRGQIGGFLLDLDLLGYYPSGLFRSDRGLVGELSHDDEHIVAFLFGARRDERGLHGDFLAVAPSADHRELCRPSVQRRAAHRAIEVLLADIREKVVEAKRHEIVAAIPERTSTVNAADVPGSTVDQDENLGSPAEKIFKAHRLRAFMHTRDKVRS
jgi:hypothetical protein